MAETRQPSLTVLGGPLAGTRFALPDAGAVTLGSSDGCTCRVDLPGVSPIHARLTAEGGRITVFPGSADLVIHLNDNPLGVEGAPLRNGDILWLGRPGEDDVVMLQCLLPRRPATQPSAPEAAPPVPLGEQETTALWAERPTAPAPAAGEPSGFEPTIALEADVIFTPEKAEEPAVEGEPLIVTTEEPETVAVPVTPPASPRAEEPLFIDGDFSSEPAVVEEAEAIVVDEAEIAGTVALEAPQVQPPPPAPAPPTPPTPPTPPPTPLTLPPPAVSAPARPAPPHPPPGPPRRAAAPSARPARSMARPAAEVHPHPPSAGAGGPRPRRSPMPLIAGAAVLLALGVGGWALWQFVLRKPAPRPVPRATPPVTRAAVPTPVPTLEPAPAPTPEAVPILEPTALPIAPPTPAAGPTPRPTPTPSPRATPTPRADAATTPLAPPPVTAPAQPSAEAQRAQQVASLLSRAEAALGGRQYEAAIGHLDEALRLDPGNPQATSVRAAAVRQRDAGRRRFVSGRTVVQTEKAQKGITGFDSGDVALQKAPDFQGRIEFEMSPASGIQPGDAWTLRVFVVNEGKKPIRVQGLSVATSVNGTGSGAPVAPRAREIAPQARVLLGETSGNWSEGTTAWSTEATVTANRGDSLRNTITWR